MLGVIQIIFDDGCGRPGKAEVSWRAAPVAEGRVGGRPGQDQNRGVSTSEPSGPRPTDSGPGRGPERPEDHHVGGRDLTRWESPLGRWSAGIVHRISVALGPRQALVLILAIGAGISAALTWAASEIYEAVIAADGVARLDHPVLEAMLRLRSPGLNAFATAWTDLGGPVGLPILAAVFMVVLAVRRRSWTPVILVTSAGVGALLMTLAGKQLVGRARPPLVDAVPPYEYSPAFPSGHSLLSLVIAGIIAYLLVLRQHRRRSRLLAIAAAGLFAFSIGLSRVFLGHHWLTDVLAAWLLGAAWLAMVITAHRLYLTATRRSADAPPAPELPRDHPGPGGPTAARVARWQDALRARPGISPARVAEAGVALHGQVADLVGRGLEPDEAFLVAVKRLAASDSWSHGVAAADAERLWRDLVLGEQGPAEESTRWRWSAVGRGGPGVMLAFAVVAGLVARVPYALAETLGPGAPAPAVLATCGIGAVAVVAAYVCWLRRPAPPVVYAIVGTVFALALLVVNLYPFRPPYDTRLLAFLHLGIALWVVIGAGYLGRAWRSDERWVAFIRFSGELAILYVLIALGGGVLVGLSLALFGFVGVPAATVGTVVSWAVPMGAAGAMVVAVWLVEARVGALPNIASVLSAVFTPLFTLVLLSFLVTLAASAGPVDADRRLLIAYDVVLAVVFALVVFSVSARDPLAAPGATDVLQVVLIASALVVDVVVLAAMAGRIGEYGASPNKLAALGENIVLLVNLAGTGWLSLRFLRGRGPYAALQRWQGRYVAVFGAWVLVVALAFPPLFGFR